ncbi:MAG: hypothetical protein MAG451_00001 [Anaerolineales bacterium]|nr:hypothetical protein [Anaerolineales bacterium]
MMWRGDTRTIYVLYDGDAPGASGRRSWDGFEDTWTPDQPESDPALQPPPDRQQPVRGFGKVWRTQPGVRERLGWALAPEEAYASPIQAFERGAVVGLGSSVYVLVRAAGAPAIWMRR